MQCLEVTKCDRVPPSYDEACSLEGITIAKLIEFDGVNLKTPKKLRYFRGPRRDAFPMNVMKGVHEPTKCKVLAGVVDVYSRVEHKMLSVLKRCRPKLIDATQICTQRATLQCIMKTPYACESCWNLSAMKAKGIIYLTRRKGERLPFTSLKLSKMQKNLRDRCFSVSPYAKPSATARINDTHIFAMFHATLETIDILYLDEIDGVSNKRVVKRLNDWREIRKCELATLKLAYYIPEGRIDWRALDWATQCFLTDAKHIVVGLHDGCGNIPETLRRTCLSDISEGQPWDLSACVAFLHKFLARVIELMEDVDDCYTVYDFRFSAQNSEITYEKMNGSFTNEMFC